MLRDIADIASGMMAAASLSQHHRLVADGALVVFIEVLEFVGFFWLFASLTSAARIRFLGMVSGVVVVETLEQVISPLAAPLSAHPGFFLCMIHPQNTSSRPTWTTARPRNAGGKATSSLFKR